MDALHQELKELIISTLNLTDLTPDQIDSAAPLFGEGLGLDSLDALELVVELEAVYDTGVDLEAEEARGVFKSVDTLADFIRKSRKN